MTRTGTVAEALSPVIARFLGEELPIAIRFWDGSSRGSVSAPATLHLNSPNALRRMLYAPGELGLSRAYVAGDLDIEGDFFAALGLRDLIAPPQVETQVKLGARAWLELVRAASSLDAIGMPLPPPKEEVRLRGVLHSKRRDAAAVTHHYNVSNDFYRLILGETMTYSCAYFERPDQTLEAAQIGKYDLICRKLGLQPGMRLLDVGCGWGGMLLHAAKHYGVEAVGVTISEPQADLASKRVAEAGLADRIDVRVLDYRDVSDGPYDAISSIGMFEHVGMARLREYFDGLYSLLTAPGRLLNHAISRPSGRSRNGKRSFIARYVFPDGELHEVGTVVSAMQDRGFEVRDVESLRESYGLTLRAWVENLERHWKEAVSLVGSAKARIWRLYMAGSALGFEAGRINVHQVLGVKSDAGHSGMPLQRSSYLAGLRA